MSAIGQTLLTEGVLEPEEAVSLMSEATEILREDPRALLEEVRVQCETTIRLAEAVRTLGGASRVFRDELKGRRDPLGGLVAAFAAVLITWEGPRDIEVLLFGDEVTRLHKLTW